MFHDLRLALRGLRRNPSFSLTVILIVAVGIGATTAVFSMIDRLLFRSLPYPEADRLVSVGMTFTLVDGVILMANDYLHLREAQTGFSSLTSWRGVADCDLTEENPQRLACAGVEWTFLRTFGIKPLIGREFTADEDRQNGPKVAIVSYGFWQSRFAANPDALGKKVSIDGVPAEIVGVLPPGFELPTLAHADLLVPQALPATTTTSPLRVFGRLKPGVTLERARETVRPYIEDSIKINLPPSRWKEARVDIRSLRDFQIQDVRLASWVLFAATISILLIVCANVANLMLARSASRQRELAVRAALGASRGRLLRQGLTEGLLLSGFGALSGCALAWTLLRIFKTLAPTSIPRMEQATLDVRVFLFALGLAVVCGILFGVAPAVAAPPEMLTSARVSGRSRNLARNLLSTAQVALSLILLSSAGLFLRSLWNLQNVAPGLNAQQVVTADITAGPHRYPNAASRQQFFDDLASRLRALPGVTAVGVSDTVPPSGFVHSRPLSALQVVGMRPMDRPIDQGAGRIAAWRSVSPGYFSALGIPILQGRAFEERDATSSENIVILSTTLARYLFTDQRALGRAVRLGPESRDYTVVGVAADVKNNGISAPADPEYYLPRKKIMDPNAGRESSLVARALHQYDGEAFVIVRSTARPEAVTSWIRTEIAAMDPTIPAIVNPMEQRLWQNSERPRFSAALLSLFAALGVMLAATGLYGLMSFRVARRTQEVGVRMALGATPAQIARLVLAHALRWAILGVVIGLAGSFAAARILRSLLFQVPANDPGLISGAAALLLAVAAAATLLPSLRAAKIDPMLALRRE